MAIVEPAGEGRGGRRRLRTRSPVDGRMLDEFDVCTADDVAAAMARARIAQKAWAGTPVRDRAALMKKALKLLVDRAERYADVIIGETGRTRIETYIIDLFPACDSLNFFASRAEAILAERPVRLHLLKMKSARMHYRPLGVVGVISPWNGPFILSINPTIHALLAGNAVIVKPSEVTPASGKLVEELFRDAGAPAGLVQVLLGDGETGAALVSGGVDKISFTGSVRTGRKVGAACGQGLVPCTLELGGKDAMIVLGDADLERAAGGAVFGAVMNAGQYCSSTERIYVVQSVAEEFTRRVVERVRALRFCTSPDEGDVGPFIFDRQLEIVDAQVKDAVAKGAEVLVGGGRAPEVGPYYYQPTVLTGVTHDMEIMTEETFGPVLPIMTVRDEAEAVRMANDSRYGLGANVWTKDRERGRAVARQMDAGSVVINDGAMAYGALEVPFGGWKESGVGQVNGAEAPLRYAHAQPILWDRLGQPAEPVWYPFDDAKLDQMKKSIKVLFGTRLRNLVG